jgi:uncharacterized membrane protein
VNSAPHHTSPPAAWNDHRIELIIGTLLRAGVLLSAGVIFLGGILYLVRNGHAIVAYHTFHGDLSSLRSFSGIARGVAQLSGRAIVQLGLLLLIATPVARVIFSAFAFAFERDYRYVVFTLIVLAILLYSIFGAQFH